MQFAQKHIRQHAISLCLLLVVNFLVGPALGGKLNPFDDDDEPAPAPAPASGPAPAPFNNQASYSCMADDGKQYTT